MKLACFGLNMDKIFKNGPSKICGRQPLKNFKWYGLPSTNFIWSILEYHDPYGNCSLVLSDRTYSRQNLENENKIHSTNIKRKRQIKNSKT